MTLSCRRDARQSGGACAFYPDSDQAAPARPQGRLRVPSVRSAALCLLCTGPSVRSRGRRSSNSAAVSCRLLHWCTDRLVARADLADGLAVVLPEVGYRLEVWHQAAG